MVNRTKDAIKQTFLALLNEKPLNQITVKMIVEQCGINRNSFYYHSTRPASPPATFRNACSSNCNAFRKTTPSIRTTTSP